MDVRFDNSLLLKKNIEFDSFFPKVKEFRSSPITFNIQFGLSELPPEPGLIVIRGARQYGKSTWLELQLEKTYREHGPGSCFYLNGDQIINDQDLIQKISDLAAAFPVDQTVRRIFIDEISSIENWTKGVKILWDRGITQKILIVTTGSDAEDLRNNAELLPGRKGKLARTNYLFTPISFCDFKLKAKDYLNEKEQLHAYILSGGSPIACRELCLQRKIPEYLIAMVRDWIFGAIASKGRQRATLLTMIQLLFKFAQNPVSSAKISREAGVANNTVIEGYLEQLKNLLCVAKASPWDPNKNIIISRKPGKIHFTNTLAAVALGQEFLPDLDIFINLSPQQKSKWYEWLIAQELWRRSAMSGSDTPEVLSFWQSSEHEIDFVASHRQLIEVKSGTTTPLDYPWFSKNFPKDKLLVVGPNSFNSDKITGITFEEFLQS